MPDKLFVVAEYKEWTADFYRLFKWLEDAFAAYLDNPKHVTIWLHPESEAFKQTIWQKLSVPIAVFEGDEVAGITELDWYLLPTGDASPFNELEADTRLYGLIMDNKQLSAATDEFGLYSMRQEFMTWGYNDKSLPNAIGAVLDCLRMVTYAFRSVAKPLDRQEQIEAALPADLRMDAIANMEDSPAKDGMLQRRLMEIQTVTKQVDAPQRLAHHSRFARR